MELDYALFKKILFLILDIFDATVSVLKSIRMLNSGFSVGWQISLLAFLPQFCAIYIIEILKGLS